MQRIKSARLPWVAVARRAAEIDFDFAAVLLGKLKSQTPDSASRNRSIARLGASARVYRNIVVGAIVGTVCSAPGLAAQSRIDPNDLGRTAILTFADEFQSL